MVIKVRVDLVPCNSILSYISPLVLPVRVKFNYVRSKQQSVAYGRFVIIKI